MSNRNLLFCLLLGILLPIQTVFGQITTIDYSSGSGLPTGVCNVFNGASPYSVGGLKHLSVCGGVSFSDTVLVLKTQVGNTLAT